jgi:hypothetical protein
VNTSEPDINQQVTLSLILQHRIVASKTLLLIKQLKAVTGFFGWQAGFK